LRKINRNNAHQPLTGEATNAAKMTYLHRAKPSIPTATRYPATAELTKISFVVRCALPNVNRTKRASQEVICRSSRRNSELKSFLISHPELNRASLTERHFNAFNPPQNPCCTYDDRRNDRG